MGQSKPKYKVMLTPEQQQAQQMLSQYIAGGPSAQPKYTGDFNLLPESFISDLLVEPGAKAGGSPIPGLSAEVYNLIMGMAKTGEPVDQTALFAEERAAAETSAARAVEQMFATGQKAGVSKYASPAVGAAAGAAAEKQVAGNVGILGQVAAAQEAAKVRKMQATSMLMQGAQIANSYKLDASKIVMAANTFTKTGNYEEWKRQFPDVYQMANLMFQNKLDWVAEKKPDWIGPALTAVAGIVATVMTGGAAAPLAAGAIANAYSQYSSPQTSPIGPSGTSRIY